MKGCHYRGAHQWWVSAKHIIIGRLCTCTQLMAVPWPLRILVWDPDLESNTRAIPSPEPVMTAIRFTSDSYPCTCLLQDHIMCMLWSYPLYDIIAASSHSVQNTTLKICVPWLSGIMRLNTVILTNAIDELDTWYRVFVTLECPCAVTKFHDPRFSCPIRASCVQYLVLDLQVIYIASLSWIFSHLSFAKLEMLCNIII